MRPLVVLAPALIGSLGCGDTVVVDPTPEAPRQVPQLPTDLPPTPETCSQPLLVPVGKAWLVRYVGIDAGGQPIMKPCPAVYDDVAGVPVQRFVVADFFLDTDEVTNSCFAACVDAGGCGEPLPPSHPSGWRNPAEVNHAVHSIAEAAEQFCAWRGGRLPTILELTRASHGEYFGVGNPTLYHEIWQCYTNWSDACTPLAIEYMQGQLPVGAEPLDVGPFGHRGLFGGLAEATASVVQRPLGTEMCDHSIDAPDPVSFGDDWTMRGYFRIRVDPPSLPPPHFALNVVVGPSDGSPTSETGFRCAYDPVYPDPEELEEAP
jgi:hypothetical protein